MCARLDALATLPDPTCWWLTSWPPDLRARLDPCCGHDWPAITNPDEDDDAQAATGAAAPTEAWWKVRALATWLEDHREITRLVWCDDDLHRTHQHGKPLESPGTDRRPGINRTLGLRGIHAALIAPTTTVGLTPQDLERIEILLGTGTF